MRKRLGREILQNTYKLYFKVHYALYRHSSDKNNNCGLVFSFVTNKTEQLKIKSKHVTLSYNLR